MIGVLLALELLHQERRVHTVSIKLDNQAVIQALGTHSAKPVQSLLNMVHNACEEWTAGDRRGCRQLGISWISGHDGIKGNERADKEARKAVSDGASLHEDLPDILQEGPLPNSLTALGGSFQVDLRERWKSLWAKSPQRGHMDKIDAKLPSPTFLAAINHLSRAETSVLMQLRMGHIPLNAFLHRISRADPPTCPMCQHTNETIHHYLFDCPGHAHAQHSLARAMGQNSKSI